MSDDGEEEEVEVQAPSVVNCSARVTLKVQAARADSRPLCLCTLHFCGVGASTGPSSRRGKRLFCSLQR